ncbi:MAG: outer-membrane lipoprotein carrier protein LolA [Bryobacteraceae bacterium]
MSRRALALIPAIFASMALGWGAPAADSPLSATLARVDEAAARFKGLEAEVQQISHTAVINEDSVAAGTIAVKRPKPYDIRVLIDFKHPNPRQVMIAGVKVAIYYPGINTVQEYNLGKSRTLVEQFMLLGFGSNSRDLESAYSIRLGGPETVAGQKATRLELIPKSQDVLAHLKRVDLWISDGMGIAVQQKLYETGGDYLLATYTNIKLRPNLPDSAVKLDLPKSVKREYPQRP